MTCGCAATVYRFMGVDWIGLPAPIRVAAWLAYAYMGWTRDGPDEFYRRFPGCGCVLILKQTWIRWTKNGVSHGTRQG